MWKYLKHQNIVPLLGVTSTPLQLISEWMPGGNLTEYVKKRPGVDRLNLVGASLVAFDATLTPPPAIRCCQGPSFPPLQQHSSWRSQGGA